jgi:hypothetical protein
MRMLDIPFGTTGWASVDAFALKPGMSYQVADRTEPHRSHTETGAKLFIVD